MSFHRSITEGLRRTALAPRLLLGLWLVNLLAAFPAALVMSEILEESIGPSLFHQGLAEGFDADWYAEFEAEARDIGLARAFTPSSVVGAGAVYDNLEAWWSGRLFTDSPLALVALGVAYGVLWAFLLGGVLDALRGGRQTLGRPGGAAFVAACGRTFGRFLLLTVASGVLYFAIYRLSRWLYGWLEDSTLDVTVERAVYLRFLAAAALAVALLHLVRMIFDYAKIAVSTGDVSALRGLSRGAGFVASRPGGTLAVYCGLGLLTLSLVAVYAWFAPGPGQSSWPAIVFAFFLSQVYLAARLAVRLSLLAAEIHLYQSAEP